MGPLLIQCRPSSHSARALPAAVAAEEGNTHQNYLMASPLLLYDCYGAFVGFLLLLFGYRFYKPALFLGGFTLAAVITFQLVSQSYSPFTTYGAAICSGIIAGTVVVFFYAVGVFVLGSIWGIVIALLLNGLFLSRISYVICECDTLLWMAISILSILFGLLAIVVHRHKENDTASHPRKIVIFGKTATTGAYMLVRSIAHMAGEFPDEFTMSQEKSLSPNYYVAAVSIIVLSVIGGFIQMRYTHFEHCGCGEEYERLDQADRTDPIISTSTIKNPQL